MVHVSFGKRNFKKKVNVLCDIRAISGNIFCATNVWR